MNKRDIEARKAYTKLKSKSEQMAKADECIWCNKRITRFCNSHSIPQFIIKSIDAEGKVDYMNSIVQIPLINDDLGIKEAGTFKLLCNDCDNKLFEDYENPDYLKSYPTEKMLEEMALKNVLVHISKRKYELALYRNMEESFETPYPYEIKQDINEIDLRDYLWNYNRIKSMLLGENNQKYRIIWWKRLEYEVPIAFQGEINLYGDLKGDIINDIYDSSDEIIMKDLNISVLPVKGETVIILFYHEDDDEYDAFCDQFNGLEESEKLEVVNYIIFKYSEDALISKRIKHRTYVKRNLLETCMDTTEIVAFSEVHAEMIKNSKRMALVNREKIPNLLSEKYKLEKNKENDIGY